MTKELPLLISAEEAANYLDDDAVLFIDRCQDALFKISHIPGAIHLSPRRLMGGQAPSPGLMPPVEELEAIFSSLGVQDGVHVIAYDDEGGGWCARLAWTFDCLGFKDYSIIDGGFQSWRAAKLPLVNTASTPTPANFVAKYDEQPRAMVDWVLANLEDADLKIWDARSPEEYSGARQFSRRGGHIPGAVNYEWTRAIDVSNQMKLRPLDEIRAELAELGVDESKTIVTHCQSHHRSAFTYFVGKLLGLNIKGYDGSWSEWGNRDDTPIELDRADLA